MVIVMMLMAMMMMIIGPLNKRRWRNDVYLDIFFQFETWRKNHDSNLLDLFRLCFVLYEIRVVFVFFLCQMIWILVCIVLKTQLYTHKQRKKIQTTILENYIWSKVKERDKMLTTIHHSTFQWWWWLRKKMKWEKQKREHVELA